MKTTMIFMLVVLGAVNVTAPLRAADNPAETKEQRDTRLKWWREAKFGMFIHWGVYSVPAGTYDSKQIGGIGEWIMFNGKIPVTDYRAFAKQFNPVKFNADEWVQIAKNAGQKYIVITSKHHDGFAMFDSKASEWNIVKAAPFKRDPLKELAAACRKHGIRLGFYYSQAQDWNNPGGGVCGNHWDPAQDGDMMQYVKNVAVPQVKEILANYGPDTPAVLWWDTPCGITKEMADLLMDAAKLKPGLILNNRLGGGYHGDSETPEQEIPATGFKGRDWETCMTMNDTWGFKSYDHNWKSTQVLLRNLIDIVSKGGNYLLNVGPTSEGLIPEPSVERLNAVGAWMKINGDAIYASSASPFKKLPFDGRCTQKPGKLYLHVFTRPTDGKLAVPIANAIKRAYLLSDRSRSLTVNSGDGTATIQLPGTLPDPIATVVVAEYEGELQLSAAATIAIRPATDGSLNLAAEDAEIIGSTAQLESKGGGSNIGYWTNVDDLVRWQATVTKPGAFTVEITYACEPGSEGSEFELSAGNAKISGKVQATKGWTDFITVNLGRLKVEQSGMAAVTLQPTKKPGLAVMNLRSIKFTPAD